MICCDWTLSLNTTNHMLTPCSLYDFLNDPSQKQTVLQQTTGAKILPSCAIEWSVNNHGTCNEPCCRSQTSFFEKLPVFTARFRFQYIQLLRADSVPKCCATSSDPTAPVHGTMGPWWLCDSSVYDRDQIRLTVNIMARCLYPVFLWKCGDAML